MAARNVAPEIKLSAQDRTQLGSFANSRSLAHAQVQRAKIVLLAADGMTNIAIAEKLGLTRISVGKWRRRYLERGIEGLYDELRAFYRGEEYLFETQTGGRYDPAYVTHRIKAVSRRTLGRALNAHCMRHSFATNTIRRTGNLKGVSEYLGHSSTSITSDLYDHSILSDADLFVAAV